MERLAPPLAEPSGIYALETTFNFNTLDAVVYDAKSGKISLIGHFDRRFIGPRIPYLQHLAALLEIKDEPTFSLETTPASFQAVRTRVASTPLSRSAVLAHFDKIFDDRGSVTWLGRSILSSLGLSPIQGHRPPGFLGAEVEALPAGGIRVRRLLAGSPANDADLRAGDEIVRFNGKTAASAEEFERLVRFAGSGNKVAIAYKRNGRPAEVSVELLPDPDSDPWLFVRQADVDALLPASSRGRPTIERLRDFANSLPAGFQIPPDLAHLVLGARVESVPQYFGEASNTQLARLLFDADYSVVKQIVHRVDLKSRFPGYQTWFDLVAAHPRAGSDAGSSRRRVWISVAKMGAVQSASGETLAFRDVKMQFNIRSQKADGSDMPSTPPELAAYANTLTRLYDDFAQDYFVLHELREATKLAAAASWIKQKTPGLKLPVEGRVAWNGPAKVPGMVYMQMPHATGADIGIIPHGGVDINPCRKGSSYNCVIPFDRGLPNPALPASNPPVAGATGKVNFDGNKYADGATFDPKQFRDPTDLLRDAVGPKLVSKADEDKEQQKIRALPANTERQKSLKAGKLLDAALRSHKKGNDDEAVKLFKEAESISPGHPSLNLLRADMNETEGNRRQAIEELKQYVQRVPDNGAAKNWLNRLQREERDGVAQPWTPPRLKPAPAFGTRLDQSGPGTSGGQGAPSQGGSIQGRPNEQRGSTPPITQPGPTSGQPGGPQGGGQSGPGGSGPRPADSTAAAPASNAPFTSAGQPRSPADLKRIATMSQMNDSAMERARKIEKELAIVREGDPCNFDQRAGGSPCKGSFKAPPVPIGKPVEAQRPKADDLLGRRNELGEARLGLQHRRNQLDTKPQETWTPEDKKEDATITDMSVKLEQESVKVEEEIEKTMVLRPAPKSEGEGADTGKQ